MSRQLSELLIREKIVTQAQVAAATAELQASGDPSKSIVRKLIENKHLSETKLLYFLSQKFGLPSINLEKFEVNPDVIKLIPMELARKHQVIPIQSNQKGTLVVAVADPTLLAGVEALKFALKMNIEAVLTSYQAFDSAFSKYYGAANYVSDAIETFQKGERKRKEDETTTGAGAESVSMELVQVHEINNAPMDQDQPVITLVNGILADSIRRKASDIHVEPYEKRFRVRLRIDGTLFEVHQIPAEMRRAVVARFKIMSRMDIGESRVPQDGRIKLKYGNQDIDFRVNTLPTLYGEKVVLRLLDKSSLKLDLEKLGFEPEQLRIFKKGIESASGMVLVTGPTGSGKTTTLYSALIELNKSTDNISTAEDPVEYNFEGINQVQVNKELGLSFPNILRALLRQDPDTILVGEIRDYETAEVAVQAALTGHLVLSTLHTNDAPSTILRLANMGVEPFLVTAAVNTIVAQRLLRMVCGKCKVEAPIPANKLVEFGFRPEDAAKIKPMRGQGCVNCNKTGYKGRVAIYEVMEFTQTLKEMVLKGENLIEIKKQALREGLKSLRMSALTKVALGVTTLEEALSSTMEN
jgi:type IV pilus assembly protein PilB